MRTWPKILASRVAGRNYRAGYAIISRLDAEKKSIHSAMKTIWTIAGDETSWPEWASRMATSPASELMRQLAFDLKEGSQRWVLDIGCGTGRAFMPLIQNGYRVIGIDPVFKAIKASDARAKKEHLHAWPVLAMANQLPIRSEGVGAIFAIGTLFHLSPREMDSALLEIKRVLCVGGEAILYFLEIGDWRQKLGRTLEIEEVPEPSHKAVVTCFSEIDAIHRKIRSADLVVQDSFLKTRTDDEGECKDWFFHCVRQ